MLASCAARSDREYGMLLLAVHERRGRSLPLVAA